jgi:hypothetical protein
MLLWLANLDFAGGEAATAVTVDVFCVVRETPTTVIVRETSDTVVVG